MKGLYQVTARRAGREITAEVYGNIAEKQTLFVRLMRNCNIKENKWNEWKLQDVKLNKEIND